MKKRVLLLLLPVVLLFLLAGCQRQAPQTRFESEIDGRKLTIDTVSQTVDCQGEGYAYTFERDGTLVITYPNGYHYSYREQNGAVATGWKDPEGMTASQPQEGEGYLDGFSLAWAILDAHTTPADPKSGRALLGILLCALGGMNLAFPRWAWTFAYGWRFKNAEPSDLALTVYRLLGVGMIFVGVLALLSGIG